MIYPKELFSCILGMDDFGEDDKNGEDEESISKEEGIKNFFCTCARYLMFGVK